MEKIRYFILMALCVIGITSCQDDLTTGTAGADVNNPVKVDLKFGIPKSMQVEVTRADNSYSGMYNARFYVFSGNTLLEGPQDVSTDEGTLVKGNAGDNGQYYTAKGVTLYEGGVQSVYVIGNTDSGYWEEGTMDKMDEAAKQGKAAFEQALYAVSSITTTNHDFPSFSTDAMPLSGTGDITVSDGQPSSTISLKRLVAQIKFKINTKIGGENSEKIVTFEPRTYTFCNMPTEAYILDGTGKETVASDVYDTTPVNIEGGGEDYLAEFSVFVPESIQEAKEAECSDYDDRESFIGTGDNKNWTCAADKAMYVILKGVCQETDSEGKLLRYGNVEYTIHLGDFSRTGSMDNFSVERNSIYTYTVSVEGMEKIRVEAERIDEDYQNGAEGNVIDMGEGATMFSLDSHYEQVFVEYNLSDILATVKSMSGSTDAEVKKNIADQFLLVIHTPMNTQTTDQVKLPYSPTESTGNEEIDMEGIDYKWIEFYPQSEDQVISLYPGKNNTEEGKRLYSPYQVCRMMGDAIYKLYQDDTENPSADGLIVVNDGGEWKARFTIFVDEYFYTEDLDGNKVAWDKFTRQDPRTMMIASEMKISEDLNSTYSKAQTYITQRAIETFYNTNAADNTNALGLETYNENGVIQGYAGDNDVETRSEDWSNGRANMLMNVGVLRSENGRWQTKSWSDYVDFTQIGYTRDNTQMNHEWPYKMNIQSAYKACLSRNRDLNGNGEIDEEEVRWYLPALSQYLRMGIGTKALSSETQLYTGDKSAMRPTDSYPGNFLNDGALYFVNTSDPRDGGDFTLYWAVEVGAYGSPGMGGGGAMIRCVRNLPNEQLVVSHNEEAELVNDESLAGPVYGQLKRLSSGNGNYNYVFDFGNRLVNEIFRNSSSPQRGPYNPHDELAVDEMKLPNAFVVADKDIQVSNARYAFGLYQRGDDWDEGDDPCSNYSEDRSDRGYWRTPNLNELMVMPTVNDYINMSTNSFSRTHFSNNDIRPGFYFNTSGMITTNGSGNDHTGPINGMGYVRCVRDATQAERDAAQPVN